MREFSADTPVPHDPTLNVPGLLLQRLARGASSVIIERSAGLGGSWAPVTVAEFVAEVTALAKGLVARGLEPGDRVAIMSRTRYEWTLTDFAVWFAGGVGVPVYETSSAEQVEWILANSGASLVVVETAAHAAVVGQVRGALPGVRDVFVIDEGGLAQLVAGGSGVADAEIERRRSLAAADDLATIIYTSGTTGRPKGVELTHGNFVDNARNGVAALAEVCATPGSRTLLFMPLAHVFARFIQMVAIEAGSPLGHTPDTRNLLADFASFRPTYILAVPRVFEKVYNSAEQKAGHGFKLKMFRWAAKVSITYSRALDSTAGPSPQLRAAHTLATTLVLRKLKDAMGGNLRYAISGGAPLGERLGHYYRGLGLVVLEGYGLTETTAPSSVNRPGLIKIGTVGPAYPGTSLRVDDDGNVYAKGPHVFRGYHDHAEATAEVLDADGWFATGDIGTLDDDGYLRLTGRAKELIVTAGGKNVAPAVLEDRFRGHPLVSQVVVVGDGRPFIGALVTLDADMLPGWLSMHGLPPMDVRTAAQHPEVLAALDRAATRANEAVSRAESIRKVRVLDGDFTEANGYLTPSLKVKRALVLEDFAADVEELYVDTRDK
ncbi:long-chain-fatty-acid--CoA ligase [Cellulomonas hominis]|uniref:Acyl-CoA synthetase n=1 Tax=Cellulomonas hominis TaxID=156981 RepID=A0A511FAE0_9CELL|nr:AMP-dependent synthetase/ligase [Cellulomonas hominis]MBB5471410.1 long-chain acyl-CoA synthetase [Cellulomonas hominis]NKY06508.1 long-chain fatty acid--CoA ligase [Cellulomonas hominis]GEL46239.1 long-chain-fatty-acid--CoA ligase [Cellulomonas hominis]